MAKVNIKGLDKAEVLLALWKGSHAQGLSFLGMINGCLTIEKARDMIRLNQVHAFERTGKAPDITDSPSPEKNTEFVEKFQEWLKTDPEVKMYFDYVEGHVIKCDLTGDEFDPRLYDRDCGEGRAEEVIEALRNNTPIEDEMSTNDDFMRCMLDLLKDDYDRKNRETNKRN